MLSDFVFTKIFCNTSCSQIACKYVISCNHLCTNIHYYSVFTYSLADFGIQLSDILLPAVFLLHILGEIHSIEVDIVVTNHDWTIMSKKLDGMSHNHFNLSYQKKSLKAL